MSRREPNRSPRYRRIRQGVIALASIGLIRYMFIALSGSLDAPTFDEVITNTRQAVFGPTA